MNFKRGMKVRVRMDCRSSMAGQTGDVRSVQSRDENDISVLVIINGEEWWMRPNELEEVP